MSVCFNEIVLKIHFSRDIFYLQILLIHFVILASIILSELCLSFPATFVPIFHSRTERSSINVVSFLFSPLKLVSGPSCSEKFSDALFTHLEATKHVTTPCMGKTFPFLPFYFGFLQVVLSVASNCIHNNRLDYYPIVL